MPLFVLIAVFAISSNVGGEVSSRNAEIDKAKKDLDSKSNAKNKGILELWDKLIEKVDGKRGDLWKKNWEMQDRQERIYAWPKSSLFAGFEKKPDVPVRIEDLRFGETIPNNRNQFDEFQKPEFYRAQFSTAGFPRTSSRRNSRGWPRVSRRLSS